MLTIKQITDDTENVIRGLEKKHFKDARNAIEQIITLNNKRKAAQNQLDHNLAAVNSLSKSIGQFMKEGNKAQAEAAKNNVAAGEERDPLELLPPAEAEAMEQDSEQDLAGRNG